MLGQVVLGKYRVSRLLAQGGLCKIWLARQLDGSREVVVKIVQESLRGQTRPRELLRREIHVLSRFSHPHAVGFIDAAPHDPRGPVLVMEYLRGIDLCALLQREGRLAPERAGRLLAQLCDVLGAAHAAGIVHADIKPANLMIVHPCTPQETLKLMDFGLAKMTALLYIGADDLADGAVSTAAGTPEYLAPEQASGQDIDGRADLYAAGVVLYEMLTRRRPFEDGSPAELLQAHLREEPPSFGARGVTDVPPAIETVVRACLAKRADQRPRDAAELIQLYEDALGKRLSAVRSPQPAIRNPAGTRENSGARREAIVDRQALRQDFEADMPETMALLKLKGFLHDLGGKAIESEPGLIRVRLGEPNQFPKKNGFLALFGGGARAPAAASPAVSTEVELRLERRDPSRPNHLHVTLIMRPGNGTATAEWRTRCQKIALDLKAYLMGR
jgi:serine/threonine protein kinase